MAEHLYLAIAQGTIPAFGLTPLLDDFDRGDEGPPMTGWTDVYGGLKVSSNACVGDDEATNLAYMDSAGEIGPDCEAYAPIAALSVSAGQAIGVGVRLDPVLVNGYLAVYTTSGAVQIYRIDAGATVLLESVTLTLSASDVIGIRAVGNVISAYANGVLVANATDDTYPEAGYVFVLIDNIDAGLSEFGGGALTLPDRILIADGLGGETDYRLVYGEWAPAIAPPRISALAGRGPYEDAAESLELNIYGATADEAYAHLQTLTDVLNQAERWARGETVDAVRLEYSPGGGDVSDENAPLQAAILGRASSPLVRVRPDFNAAEHAYVIHHVRVEFVRQGNWVIAEQSASTDQTANGELLTITMPAALSARGPTRFALGGAGMFADPYTPCFVLLADRADAILSVDTDGFDAENLAVVDDSAKFAWGGNILRYTPPDTAEHIDGALVSFSPNADARLFAVLASLRNNSAVASYTVRVTLRGTLSTSEPAYTQRVVIPPSADPHPQWHHLGLVATLLQPAGLLGLGFQASEVDGTLDIDRLVLVEIAPTHHILGLYPPSAQVVGDVVHDHHWLEQLSITIVHNAQINRQWSGDADLFTQGAVLYAMLLGTGGQADLDRWRQVNGLDALLNVSMTVNRFTSYLTPQ